jgi:hypothetical protein
MKQQQQHTQSRGTAAVQHLQTASIKLHDVSALLHFSFSLAPLRCCRIRAGSL